MAKKISSRNIRYLNLGGSLVLIGLIYLVASRAIFTGSWWEYGGTLLLIIIFINRIIKVFKPNK